MDTAKRESQSSKGFRTVMLAGLLVAVALFLYVVWNREEAPQTRINENVIQMESFSVASESTERNSSVKGTIFYIGEEEIPEKIQIAASISIDPDDWGGTAIYIPRGWHVSSIVSSYPDNESVTAEAKHVTVMESGSSELEWNKYIEFGRTPDGEPSGGGSGTVVIDLVPDPYKLPEPESPQSINFMISVGSDERDGVKVSGTDHIVIEAEF